MTKYLTFLHHLKVGNICKNKIKVKISNLVALCYQWTLVQGNFLSKQGHACASHYVPLICLHNYIYLLSGKKQKHPLESLEHSKAIHCSHLLCLCAGRLDFNMDLWLLKILYLDSEEGMLAVCKEALQSYLRGRDDVTVTYPGLSVICVQTHIGHLKPKIRRMVQC